MTGPLPKTRCEACGLLVAILRPVNGVRRLRRHRDVARAVCPGSGRDADAQTRTAR